MGNYTYTPLLMEMRHAPARPWDDSAFLDYVADHVSANPEGLAFFTQLQHERLERLLGGAVPHKLRPEGAITFVTYLKSDARDAVKRCRAIVAARNQEHAA